MAEGVRLAAGLAILVLHSPSAGVVHCCTVVLEPGSTVLQALEACRRAGVEVPPHAVCGIWGRVVAPDTVLRDGDRLELYRPLTVDPKEARRQRFARQGARSTGLFARKRPGAKAGY